MVRFLCAGCLLGLVAASSAGFAQDKEPKELTDAQRQKLAVEARKLNGEGFELYQQGKPAEAIVKWRQALALRQRLYPESKYPNGHADLATSINNLGIVLRAMGQAENGLPFFEQALAMNSKLYPERNTTAATPSSLSASRTWAGCC